MKRLMMAGVVWLRNCGTVKVSEVLETKVILLEATYIPLLFVLLEAKG